MATGTDCDRGQEKFTSCPLQFRSRFDRILKKFEENEPGYYDVIYMDIMMPNMNGWDATRKIRSMQRPDAGTIPIIAMSANAFAEDIINSRISGMNRHIAKPLDVESVLNVFKECINISENKEKNK